MKRLSYFLFAIFLSACGGGRHSTGVLPAAPHINSAVSLSGATMRPNEHTLYVSVTCAPGTSTRAPEACINTYTYNPSAHTLHLLRRLEIPSNYREFALDKNDDIVVGTPNGVYFYHNDASAFMRPFRTLAVPTNGYIAISGDDTLFVAGSRPVPTVASGDPVVENIAGYTNASGATPHLAFHHYLVDNNPGGFNISPTGLLAADAYANVYEEFFWELGQDFVVGWAPSDTGGPIYPCGSYAYCTFTDPGMPAEAQFYDFGLNVDRSNNLVAWEHVIPDPGIGPESWHIVAGGALTPTFHAPPAFFETAAPEGSPFATTDGENAVFAATNNGSTGQIKIFDYAGNYKSQLSGIAPQQLIYR